jgi:beta-lactamase superfamily II metal-dependent hydrolase
MFRVTLLPAGHGDCIWIELGTPTKPRNILIDAGTPGTYERLKALMRERFGAKKAHFDLFVITHIDEDHIGGAVDLLEDTDVTYSDIWFNGWKHITEKYPKNLGAKQAELVSDTILRRKLPWNKAFNRKAIVLEGKPKPLRVVGAKLTLLSPYREQLHALVPKWKKELIAAGLVDSKGNLLRPKERAKRLRDTLGAGIINVPHLLKAQFESDEAPANGSSIAFLLQYKTQKAIFTGDAHVPVLMKSLGALSEKPLAVELLKLAHHGSDGNTSSELLQMLECPRFLISTNGAHFEHPNPSAVARVIARRAKNAWLYFNYETGFTSPWKNPVLQRNYRYRTVYPLTMEGGCTIEL